MPGSLRFVSLLWLATGLLAAGLPLLTSHTDSRVAASCGLDDDGIHLLQVGVAGVQAKTGKASASAQASNNLAAHEGPSEDTSVSPLPSEHLRVARQDDDQEAVHGSCKTLQCWCHRMHIGGSVELTAFLAFLCFVVVIGGCLGFNKEHGSPGLPPSEWLWKRVTCICAVSFVSTCGLCVFIKRCTVGHLEFVHIPKNGGTSVEVAGFESGFYWGAKSLVFVGYQAMPDGSTCSRYHVPPSLLEGRNPYRGARTFCFTRDPYERAISEYMFLLSASWGTKYAEQYDDGLYTFPACSSQGLNHFLQKTLTRYRSGSKYIDDCHHLPQTDYIFDADGHRLCDDILRLDGMPYNFEKLMKKHGYPVELPGLGKMLDTSDVCDGLTVDALTEETKALLQEVYADDFRLLTYSA